jgi:hypothetical protein
MLPRARAEARKDPRPMDITSGLGKALSVHFKEGNLDALLVYPAPKGGWHADVRFKNLPPGIPEVMGTPVSLPLVSMADAEKRVYDTLVVLLSTSAGQSSPPVFILHGFEVTLSSKALNNLKPIVDSFPLEMKTPSYFLDLVSRTVAEAFPVGFSGDRLNNLDHASMVKLAAALTTAALGGVFRYPPRPDLAPGESEPDPSVRH